MNANAQTPDSKNTTPADAAPAYQDRVIAGYAEQNDHGNDASASTYDSSGWPRYIRLQTGVGTDTFDSDHVSTATKLYALIEMPNYGGISADLSSATHTGQPIYALRQRALPVAGGWLVNNEMGVVASPAPNMTRYPSRIYLPGILIEGVSTDWVNSRRGLQLQASTGYLSQITSAFDPGFEHTHGRGTALNAELDFDTYKVAGRLITGTDVADTRFTGADQTLTNSQTEQVSIRRETPGFTLQTHLLSTQMGTLEGSRNGIWVDAEIKEGSRKQFFGYYWLDPNLSVVGQPIANDAAGVYWRASKDTRQWSIEGGLDWLNSVSERSQGGVFGTGSASWRYSRDLTLALGGSIRHFNGDGWSAFGNAQWKNALGTSGVNLNVANEIDQTHSHLLTLSHEWPLGNGQTLSASLSRGTESTASQRYDRWGAALTGSFIVGSDVSVHGNLTTDRNSLGAIYTSIGTGLNWQISRRWSMDASYYSVHGQSVVVASIDPLATPLPPTIVPTDRSSFLMTFRYEFGAGSRTAPLGGRSQDGGGAISGAVYMDANRDGERQANELGVAGVTVLLDGRYAVTTDGRGRFEFPFVVSGVHTVSVQNETLPLPWMSRGDGKSIVEVQIRENQSTNIGVIRQSD